MIKQMIVKIIDCEKKMSMLGDKENNAGHAED